MSLSDFIRMKGENPRRSRRENQKDIHNPWPGLAAYSDPLGSIYPCLFCGRDKESFEMTRLIDDNVLVTLYGRSGNGKSSLLNAGVFPLLRKMQYVPISIRLGTTSHYIAFQESIVNAIQRTIREDCREEVWAVDPVQDTEENNYLWAYFARHRFYADAAHQRPVYPVIVFDQFEEVFRKRQDEAETLLRQISYMMDRSHVVESRVLNDGTDYDYEYNFRFVISIREDDLFLLEDSIDNNYLQEMKQTRYRLHSISMEGAREVILKPAEKEHLFAEEDKERIVDTIIDISKGTNESIGTNVLSLICNRIYALYHEKQDEKGGISYQFVEQFVSGNPLERFYLEATKNLSRKQRAYLEDNLVDDAERRGYVLRENFDEVFRENGKDLLSGPLRILQESNERVELIHDSFCRVLLDQKARRKDFWRAFVEHSTLAAVCVVICIICDHLLSYWIDLPPSESLIGKILSRILPLFFFWCVFLCDVVLAFRRSLSVGQVLFSTAMLAIPLLVNLSVPAGATSFPHLYYPLAFLLAAFLIGAMIYVRRGEPANKISIWDSVEVRPLRVWLFIFLFYINWVSYPSQMFVSTEYSYYKFYALFLLVPLFYSFFDRENGSVITYLMMALMAPLAFFVYCTSDTEYLKLTISGLGDYLIVLGFGVGMFVYELWLLLTWDENKKKTKAILQFLLIVAAVFAFYSLLYRHKLLMLVIWSIVSVNLIALLFYEEERKNLFFAGALTVIFTVALHIFMTGYNPVIRERPDKLQDSDWWWNNVIVKGQDGYRLRDAVDGKDVLGLAFARHDRSYVLSYPLKDSLGYSLDIILFTIPGEDNAFTYEVYPDFERKIHRRPGRDELPAQVFRKSRQYAFSCLSGESSPVFHAADRACFQQLLEAEERETIRLLEEETPSVIKNRIARQLCQGISCSWLAAGFGRDMRVNEDAYFAYIVALSTFARCFYADDLLEEETFDWEGFFERMMEAFRTALRHGAAIPSDTYLQDVLPRLLNRYLESSDYGQDEILWVKIVRLQQLAILSGLGDNEWAHDRVMAPVVRDILEFYLRDYQNASRDSSSIAPRSQQ